MRNILLTIALSSLPLAGWWAMNQDKPIDVFVDQPETFGCMALIAAAGSLSIAGTFAASGKERV